MKFIRELLNIKKRLSFWLLLILLPLFFLNLGKGSLFSFDEAWYAEIARNIIKYRNPFLLQWNGGSFIDQPPVGFWLMAMSFKIFGINEFAARFFSAFLGFGSVLLLYATGKELFNKRVGFLAGLMLASSVWFILRARSGNLDVILVFFILLSFYSAIKIEEKRLFLYLVAVSTSLLLLVKYLIGLGIIPVIFYYFLKNRSKIKKENFVLSVIIFVFILLPYYFVNYLNFGPPFLKHILNIGIRGQGGNFQIYYQLPLFYLHMGIREWYYPMIIAFFGNLFFIKKAEIRLLYIYIISFSFPFLTSSKTEIWHLIPLYPGLGLMIFSFADNSLKLILNFVKNKKKALTNITTILLVFGGVLLSLKQVKEYWFEVIAAKSTSEEARLSLRALQFKEPLFLTDYYFPTVVFYSQKKVNFIGPKVKYLGKKITSIRELFDNMDEFILLTTENVLEDNQINKEEYELVEKENNKILIRKK